MDFFVLFRYAHGPFATEFSIGPPDVRGDAPRCPACGKFTGGLTWLPPYTAILRPEGEAFGDLVYGPGLNLLVSERFAALWRDAGLSGLTGFDPVEILDVEPRKIDLASAPSYLRVRPIQGEAALDETVVVREEPFCEVCRQPTPDRVSTMRFEEGTWAGEDLFIPRGLPGQIVVTERVAEWAESARLRNVVLMPASEFVEDPYAPFHFVEDLEPGGDQSE